METSLGSLTGISVDSSKGISMATCWGIWKEIWMDSSTGDFDGLFKVDFDGILLGLLDGDLDGLFDGDCDGDLRGLFDGDFSGLFKGGFGFDCDFLELL
jgi:hypothetical protein